MRHTQVHTSAIDAEIVNDGVVRLIQARLRRLLLLIAASLDAAIPRLQAFSVDTTIMNRGYGPLSSENHRLDVKIEARTDALPPPRGLNSHTRRTIRRREATLRCTPGSPGALYLVLELTSTVKCAARVHCVRPPPSEGKSHAARYGDHSRLQR